jgi:2,3-bisphosphoglycerate-dependent phosphoglycerate mutase
MTLFYVIRHGETLWNLEGRFQGQLDSDLSPLGYQQIEALQKHFDTLHLDALYSSDLGRAHKTAQAIASHKALHIELDPRLRERSFGIFEGMLREEARQKAPESYEAWTSGTFGEVVPGGESRKTLCERVITALEHIATKHPQQAVGIVTHGGVLASLWRALEPDRSEERGFSVPNASISQLIFESGSWRIVEWSNINHLKGLQTLDDGDQAFGKSAKGK